MTTSSTRRADLYYRLVSTRYLLSLSMLGAILLAGYFIFVSYLNTTKSDGYLINISGRQRMLAQRIALLAFERHFGADADDAVTQELLRSLALMESANVELVDRYRSLGGEVGLDEAVRDYIARVRSGRALWEKPEREKLDRLLAGLDRSVAVFQKNQQDHQRIILLIQTSVLVLGLLALVFSGLRIFRPMAAEIRRKGYEVERERARLQILLEVAIIGNKSEDPMVALGEIIRLICGHTGWPVGHAYAVTPTDPDLLVSTGLWSVSSEGDFGAFREMTERTPLRRGKGLSGRALESGEPVWISDVSKDSNFPRNKTAIELGVRSAFAFPVVIAGGQIPAVLEFFSDAIIEKDAEFLEIIGHVGQQMGMVYERSRLKAALLESNKDLEERVFQRTEELRNQQQSLLASSKMSALGEMAGGIAHEINNPLAVIELRAQQLKELSEGGELDPDFAIEASEAIFLTADRIARIVRSLREFARDGGGDPFEPATIQVIVKDALELCGERFRNHGVAVDVGLPADALVVECRSVQVVQVLLNLLNNAFDAVEPLEKKWVKIEVVDRQTSVEIAIIDSGTGITEKIRDKMMQPFFTTKPVGKGTGIGLSISRGIIRTHNGDLSVDAASANTRFVFFLPKTQPRHASAASSTVERNL